MADHLFEIYKLLVEEVREARRARREISNVFFTLNVTGIAALTALAADSGTTNPTMMAWSIIALGLTCIIWRTSNTYYTRILAVKYKDLYARENALGISPLQDEWASLGRMRRTVQWFTLERTIPLIFIIGYITFFAVAGGALNLSELGAGFADFVQSLPARLRN